MLELLVPWHNVFETKWRHDLGGGEFLDHHYSAARAERGK